MIVNQLKKLYQLYYHFLLLYMYHYTVVLWLCVINFLDDADEDYKVDDMEADNAASEEEMDEADEFDSKAGTLTPHSHSSVMFRQSRITLLIIAVSSPRTHYLHMNKECNASIYYVEK